MAHDTGDDACWLDRVCDRCGGFIDDVATHACRRPVPHTTTSTTASTSGSGTTDAYGEPMHIWVDHLVLAAPSLESGIDHVRRLTGVAPVYGGRHDGAGTHNALVSLGAPSYLEVLAPDPEQTTTSALLGTAELTVAHLHGFAIGCDDLDEAVRRLRAAGLTEVTDPFSMTRDQADGTQLAWRLAFLGGRIGGARPFLISWGDTPSPAATAPDGGRLVTVRAGDADPSGASMPLAVLGVEVAVEKSPTPWLRATIATQRGDTVELR